MRNITRSLIRVLTRSGYEATPFPKGTDNVQLVNVVQDTSHLAPLVTNASQTASIGQAAGGVGIFSGALLQAPAERTLAIYFLANVNSPGANMQIMINPVISEFTAFLPFGQLEWGDEPLLSTFARGEWSASFNVLARMNVGVGEVGFTPIFISPGEAFGIAHVSADTTFAAELAFTELG